MYINDIVDIFEPGVQVKLFADDVKIYVVINDIADCMLLQRGLDNLAEWAERWQLKISITKCAVLHIGWQNENCVYNINNVDLPNVDSISDLGVTMDSDLKFSKHINVVVCKANQRSSLILRCFKSRDPAVLSRAFTVYVRPLLEYCSQVWSPCYVTDVRKVESVQRRFTRRLVGMQTLSYSDRLNKLKLESLELRRLKFDLLYVYKMFKGLVNLDCSIFQLSTVLHLRGHSCKLVKPVANINIRCHSFACRIIDAWNSLPQTTIIAPSVNAFKKSLNKVNFNIFLQLVDD
jgi:hypothetical protein